eukprot:2750366-Rhodomonas_salina.1
MHKGNLWVSLEEVSWSSKDIASAATSVNRSEFWKRRMQPAGLSETLRGSGGRTHSVSRQGHNTVDAYGRDKMPEAEDAHLLPHSNGCRKDWLPYLRFIVGVDQDGPCSDEALLAMLFGWKSPMSEKIVDHSCIVNEHFNFVSLENQKYLLDAFPRLLFMPMMSLDAMSSWNGEAYNCLVIPLCANDLVRTGGNEEESSRPDESHAVSSDGQSRPLLKSTFDAFASMMCLVLRHRDVTVFTG